MKKYLILFVARPGHVSQARALAAKIALVLLRLREFSRGCFEPALSPALAGNKAAALPSYRKPAAITFHPRMHPGPGIIAIRGLARSYRSRPVKIQRRNRS